MTNQIRDIVVRIAQPFTIRKVSTVEENSQYSEEKASRESALRTAKHLNTITIGSGVIALVGLGAVYMQYHQSRTTFETGNRAWLGIVKVTYQPLAVGQIPKAMVEVQNYGNTVAAKYAIAFKEELFNCPEGVAMVDAAKIDREIGPEIEKLTFEPGRSVIFPKASSFEATAADQVATDALVNSEQAGTTIRVVYGKIIYTDIFRHAHKTTFCNFKDPRLNTLQGSNCGANVNSVESDQ